MDPKAATFSLFPKLPKELRLLTWSHALFPKTPPAILHTNSESRAVALKALQPSFGTSSQEASIYFDFAIDTLFLDDWLATVPSANVYPEVGPMAAIEVEGIERLAFSSETFATTHPRNRISNALRDTLLTLLSRFKNLQTLHIVFEPGDLYPTSKDAIHFVNITVKTRCASANEAAPLRREWCPIRRLKRRCEVDVAELREHANEMFQSSEPWDPTNLDEVPLKVPDIRLVAAFRAHCLLSDFGCIGNASLGALDLTAATPGPVSLRASDSRLNADSDSVPESRDGETPWEDRYTKASSSEDEDDFEEDEDLAAELEGELSDIIEDETKYIEQVGYKFGADPQGW